MVSVRFKLNFVGFLIAILNHPLIQFGNAAKSSFRSSLATQVNKLAVKAVEKIADEIGSHRDDRITQTLCKLNTSGLIEYYGFKSQVYKVKTKDNYTLTVFRCNSKTASPARKKAVILQHGLITSSDGFTMNIPEQALAYVMANAGFDVWLPNNRGNFYSKKHDFLNPSDPKFWDFSWYELAINDCPAVIDFVLKETGHDKVYIIGHSQGTTTLMAMLAELPAYNKKVAAASLMGPVGYLKFASELQEIEKYIAPLLKKFKLSEFLPRTGLSHMLKMVSYAPEFRDHFFDMVFGPSVNQLNETMIGTFFCHEPSGASAMQVIHYAQQLNHGFFGKFVSNIETTKPKDFDFSAITVPLSIHYSPVDKFTHRQDISKLCLKLDHTLKLVQTLTSPYLSHVDFIWGKNTAKHVYSEILKFFEKY